MTPQQEMSFLHVWQPSSRDESGTPSQINMAQDVNIDYSSLQIKSGVIMAGWQKATKQSRRKLVAETYQKRSQTIYTRVNIVGAPSRSDIKIALAQNLFLSSPNNSLRPCSDPTPDYNTQSITIQESILFNGNLSMKLA